jgi:hypothetical protein
MTEEVTDDIISKARQYKGKQFKWLRPGDLKSQLYTLIDVKKTSQSEGEGTNKKVSFGAIAQIEDESGKTENVSLKQVIDHIEELVARRIKLFPHTLVTSAGHKAIVTNPEDGVYDLKITYTDGSTDDIQFRDAQRSNDKTGPGHFSPQQTMVLDAFFAFLLR